MLEQIYTSTKLVENTLVPITWVDEISIFYINDMDAMIMICSPPSGKKRIYKVFRDGTTCFVGRVTGGDYVPLPLNRGRLSWLTGYPTYYVYASDEISYLPHSMENILPNYTYIESSYEYLRYIDLNKGRYINSNTYGHIFCRDAETNAVLWSFIPLSPYNSGVKFCYADQDHIMRLGSISSSRLFGSLININTGAVINTVEFLYAPYVTYDYNHGVFITIGSDYLIRIYVSDYYPASFGPIIPEHYGLYSYIGQSIKVQLLAVGGFPCINRKVAWSVSGLGYLESPVSITDANGYAWNYYYGPTTAGGIDTITVEWG